MKYLRENVKFSPLRALRLIKKAVSFHKLDLTNATVLTEASNGYYSIGPVLSVLAGAKKVFAVIAESKYSSRELIRRDLGLLARLAGAEDKINIVTEKSPALIGECDIVTNTGFVRPIDKKMINLMKDTAVIPLMYETWEFRKSDIDLKACRKKGIAVLGTDEIRVGVDIFGYAGLMCIKLLSEVGFDIKNSKIMVIENCKFGPPIVASLKKLGSKIISAGKKTDFSVKGITEKMNGLDAVIVVCDPKSGVIIGNQGWLRPGLLADLCKQKAGVLQFFGQINRPELKKAGIRYFPLLDPGKGHMGMTLGAFDPKPQIYLFAASLRVAEIMWRARSSGLSAAEAQRRGVRHAPGQNFH